MESIVITKTQARRFMLAHQGLGPSCDVEGTAGVLDYIRRVGCIQYDPLNIVGRNPELVLQARVPDFRPTMLYDLLYKDRRLLDGYDKMMAIYPVEDWPYFRRHREAMVHDLDVRRQSIASVLPEVRRTIQERGPLSSADLDYDQAVDWPWGPTRIARAALESMYLCGELIVHHKVNTRKVYDLASRHVSQQILLAPDPNGTEEEYHDWHVHRRIGGLGLLWGRSGEAWLGTGLDAKGRGASLARLTASGRVSEARIEGMRETLYMRSDDLACLDRSLRPNDTPPHARILAPLDNLLWDRRLVKDLFDFEYRWEVYKPVAERKYGYYVLPILYGDRFIARFEPGRDKTTGALLIRNWWWEAGVEPTAEMHAALALCFDRFSRYLGVDGINVGEDVRERQRLDWLCTM